MPPGCRQPIRPIDSDSCPLDTALALVLALVLAAVPRERPQRRLRPADLPSAMFANASVLPSSPHSDADGRPTTSQMHTMENRRVESRAPDPVPLSPFTTAQVHVEATGRCVPDVNVAVLLRRRRQ